MPDEPGSLVLLAGSERTSLPDVADTAPLNTQERAQITVVLRRRAELPAEIVEGPTVLSHAELGGGYGADPADVDLVSRELTSRGLEVTAVYPATRRVTVAGTLGDLSRAFGTTLRQVSSPDPRGGGLVAGGEGGNTEDCRAARGRGAARARARSARRLPLRGQAADRRPGRRRAVLGR